jgi:hypothetical protein
MRKKLSNVHFTFLVPGHWPGDAMPPKDAPRIAIPNTGEFVSIDGARYGGETSCAVFFNPQDLRDLAHVLEEAADLLEENRAKAKRR